MDEAESKPAGGMERFRGYLMVLARGSLDQRLRRRVDASDVVQDTLLMAHHEAATLQTYSEPQIVGWLQRVLANKLANIRRDHLRERRDIRREVSLEAVLKDASGEIEKRLCSLGSSVGSRLGRLEMSLRVSDCLQQLPPAQREAIILHYLEDLPLSAMALRLERTEHSVAGLLRRGMKQLRESLEEKS